MKKLYEEIMDRIEVTEEMQERIMANIRDMDLESPSQTKRRQRVGRIRLYASLAACCILLVAGIMVTQIKQSGSGGFNSGIPGIEVTDETTESVRGSIPAECTLEEPEVGWVIGEEYASALELSEYIGFDIADISSLPFEPEHSEYQIRDGDIAEITYRTGETFAVFRKSVGNKDNSEADDSYDLTQEITVGENTVTLKGEDDGYRLAVWAGEGYSYSLYLSIGVPEEEWRQIISEIK